MCKERSDGVLGLRPRCRCGCRRTAPSCCVLSQSLPLLIRPPCRVWPGGLNMARTIGDAEAGEAVAAEPEASGVRGAGHGVRVRTRAGWPAAAASSQPGAGQPTALGARLPPCRPAALLRRAGVPGDAAAGRRAPAHRLGRPVGRDPPQDRRAPHTRDDRAGAAGEHCRAAPCLRPAASRAGARVAGSARARSRCRRPLERALPTWLARGPACPAALPAPTNRPPSRPRRRRRTSCWRWPSARIT